MGADYIQYFISDAVSSPEEYWKYYSEKLILMPHAFLATSMAYLGPDMTPPSRETPSPEVRYQSRSAVSHIFQPLKSFSIVEKWMPW